MGGWDMAFPVSSPRFLSAVTTVAPRYDGSRGPPVRSHAESWRLIAARNRESWIEAVDSCI